MKASRFNIFIRLSDGKRLAFNSASAALAEVLPDKYPIIEEILSSPDKLDSKEKRELAEQLLQGKFLIEDETDEIIQLKVANRIQRFGKDVFSLTIAPTLACNFKCDYCFETRKKENMNEETEKALLDFSEKLLRRTKGVMLTWFGGEPTLCLSTIERLQKEFQKLSSKYELYFYPGSIVTNGYLLNKGMSETLKDLGITNAQVTLDGPEKIHDSRRKLHSGKGTFERILNNLKESCKNLSILVRVNLDKDNLDSGYEVIEILEKERILPLVNVYFGQIRSSDNVCADIRDRCLSGQEFSAQMVELYKRLFQNNFRKIIYPMLAAGGFCGADSDGSFVVSPAGDLFKCWEEVSNDSKDSVGNIFTHETEPFQRRNLNRYLSWDPFEKSECLNCNILPVCMGGCPYLGMKYMTMGKGSCSSWKYNLKDMLWLKYLCEQNEKEG